MHKFKTKVGETFMIESFHGKRLSSLFKVITVFLSIGTIFCACIFSVELRVRLQFSSFIAQLFQYIVTLKAVLVV